MPGVYREQIVIRGEVWGVGNSSSDKAISIRPSFPLVPNKGVTIMHYNESQSVKNQPCIVVSTRDEETLLQGVQKGISVTMSHLNIVVHSQAFCGKVTIECLSTDRYVDVL